MKTSELSGIRLLDKKQVLERVRISFPTIWKAMREGKFPRGREVGGKTMWIEAEVDEYIVNLPVKRLKGDPDQSSGEAA